MESKKKIWRQIGIPGDLGCLAGKHMILSTTIKCLHYNYAILLKGPEKGKKKSQTIKVYELRVF